MMRVAVRIFHPQARAGGDQPLTTWLQAARARVAERHRVGFEAAGAVDVLVVSDPPGDIPFGRRLRDLLPRVKGLDGLVVLGSGAVPLATPADRRRFVAAAGVRGTVLANNHYSADIVAIGGLAPLAAVPDLATDNALPRWLAASAGYKVADLRGRWRLAIDLDSPLDVLLVGSRATALGVRLGALAPPPGADLGAVGDRLAAVARVATDPQAELVVTGRTSAATLAWLERTTTCRVRAIVEERGLRAGADARLAGGDARLARGHAQLPGGAPDRHGTRRAGRDADGQDRPPASLLGAQLDRDGPGALGGLLARLGDGAVVDTRVLLAHRLGRDEAPWPSAEDRFASDLLLPGRIADPWLRQLTASALKAPIPVLLGAHTLVGPGLRLLLRPGPA